MSEEELSQWVKDRLAQAEERKDEVLIFEMPDPAEVERYIAAQMPQARDVTVSNLERIAYGAAREHYTFNASWREGATEVNKTFVMLRDRELLGDLVAHLEVMPAPDPMLFWLQGKGDRETEFRLLKCLENTGVPAPHAWWLNMSGEWLQRPFMIQEKIPGQVAPSFTLLGLEDPAQKRVIGQQFVDILARIHTVDWRATGMDFLGVPEAGSRSYPDKVIECLDRRLAISCQERPETLRRAFLWLGANRPVMETVALCHGDYKTDNIMFQGDRITAILDWEFAHLGDPLEDVGWVCMRLYTAAGLCMGLVPRQEFLERYAEGVGRPLDPARLRFWEVVNNVRMIAFSYTLLESAKLSLQLAEEMQVDFEMPDPEGFWLSLVNRMMEDLEQLMA